jgi:outer membrane protein insertion porin family
MKWLVLFLLASAAAHAGETSPDTSAEFTVGGIRVEGLQRITEGTVFNTLPINIGDHIGSRRVREALRALYDTGFFRDVEFRRDGSDLVIVVQERPSIRMFDVKGNKEIKSDDLMQSLRKTGLASGKILNRSTLEDVRQYLIEQYFARGRYDVRVDARVEDQPNNTVDVHVDIDEGKRVKIRNINVVGNEHFTDEELLAGMELKSSNWLSFYRGDDKYSRPQLEGDMEKLRSYYMDRGYADFEITSTQVTLAPEKDDLFITLNVFEGTTWKVGAVKLAGRFVVPEAVLRAYVLVQAGDQFSRRLIVASEEALRNRLNDAGFGFAEVVTVPVPDPATGEVSITFQIEPNARTYVRHIIFNGVEKTRDEVLRREMRQLEGAVLSNAAVDRSKERLQRLPYLTKVETETKPVPGSADLVDVDVTVEEGPSSSLGGGVGYSERQAFTLSGNFVDSNLFGSGDRLAIDLNGGKYGQVYSVAHTDPYFTVNGVSRSLSASYIERDRITSSFSQFSTQTYSAGFGIGYPIAEEQYLNLGLTFSHENLATASTSSAQLRDWVRNNGDYYFRRVDGYRVLGTLLDTLELNAGWLYDSRNRTLFPTSGGSHRLSLSYAPPSNGVSYATANFRSQQFFKIPGWDVFDKFPFSVSTNIGWSTAFGDTTAVPPHRHVFTGGADSVRGFEDGSLGPRDSLGNPYGGDAGFSAQFEAIIPLPAKFQTSARVSLFYDIGQSYFLGDTEFRNKRGDRTDYRFDLGELRSSAGIAVQWLSPMGLFKFSWAKPLRYQSETRREFGDELEPFQFSIGTAF